MFAALPAAGCSGDGESNGEESAGPPPQSAEASAAYERAYSECATTTVDLLAGKYKVTPSRAAIAQAVGAAWADTLGGGPLAVEAGASGCRDGFQARVSESSS